MDGERRGRLRAARKPDVPADALPDIVRSDAVSDAAAKADAGVGDPPTSFGRQLDEHLALFERLRGLEAVVSEAAERLAACLSTGGKLLICGNGASAAGAQQLAAELAGHGSRRQLPLAVLPLCADTAAWSGSAAAHGFDEALARQVRALGRAGDALLLLHAAGPLTNLLRAAEVARDAGLLTLGVLAGGSAALRPACHLVIMVPAEDAQRAGEAQQFVGHALCGLIERTLGLA